MKVFIRLLIISIGLFFTVACSSNSEMLKNEEKNTPSKAKIEEVVEEEKPTHKEITISAIGDLLYHTSVYEDAKTKEGYDFTPMFSDVEAYLSEATITFANQETMIGGVEHGLSSYPSFNSPKEAGDALKEVGVDVVSIANNHTLDRGEPVIQSSIEHWNQLDMTYVGAYKNQEDKENLRIIETEEGMTVAFLAYTYGTNGIPIPEGKEYLVNLIDKENIKEEIERANKEADATVLSFHFGEEYQPYPSDEQKDLVQFAADHGVHAVIGHHPHVLQPIEWVEGDDGHKTLVIYSLGNFLSGQNEIPRQIGGMFNFTIKQTIADDTIEVISPKFLPTFVSYDLVEGKRVNYNVAPMHKITDEDLPNSKKKYQETVEHMTQWLPELEIIKSEDELINEKF